MSRSCISVESGSNIKVEENRRKAIFKNPERTEFTKIRVDDCLITEGTRCDYIVSKNDCASVLIELKGSDVSHACDQLKETINHPSVTPLLEQRVGFLVICSKYPKFDTFVAKAKQHFAKHHGAGFHVVCNKGEFDIERVTEIDGPY